MPGNKEIRRPAAIKLLPAQKGEEFLVCQILTASLAIYRSKKEKEGTSYQLETTLEISTPFNWDGRLL